METRRLDYFVRIVDAGSITRAAAALGIAQPALSQQLAILEHEMGATLLHRSRRGVNPTAAGRQLYRQARTILRQVAAAHAQVRAADDSVAGRIAVGLPNSAAAILALPLLRTLAAEYPGVDLHLVEGYSGMLTEMTEQGGLDLAVLFQKGPRPGLSVTPLWDEDLLLVSPPGAAHAETVALAVLAELPMMIPSPANSARIALDQVLARRGIGVDIALEADSIVTLKKAVAEGLGHTILPWSAVADEVERGTLRVAAFKGRPLKRPVALTVPDDVAPSPARDAVARIILDAARAARANPKNVGMCRARPVSAA